MSGAIGVIGGSGLYGIDGLDDVKSVEVETPFGKPSSPVTVGKLAGQTLLFIARHGTGHTLTPSEVNYRANIFALKTLGAAWCVSVSACGSLQEQFAPGDAVVPDQFIDRTVGRKSTFFGEGVVAHVAFGTPFCPVLKKALFETAAAIGKSSNKRVHNGATYVCMEGPAFSTRAESNLYRSWGAGIIGMTNLTEAKLAREAEIAYASLALVTDYDCWRSESDDVDVTELLRILKENTDFGREVLKKLVPALAKLEPSELAANALKFAIFTQPNAITSQVKERLKPLIGRYC